MGTIELKNYRTFVKDAGSLPVTLDFTLAAGDFCEVRADNVDQGHQFLEALAMIGAPVSGRYRFNGYDLSRQRYGQWLHHRRRICYIGPVSSLISNLTIRENLLLSRFYYENDLQLELAADVKRLCHAAGLDGKLSARPGELNPMDRRIAIAIRELTREPALAIVDTPDDLVGHPVFNLLLERLQDLHRQGVAVVMMSDGENPIRQMINRNVTLAGGRILQ